MDIKFLKSVQQFFLAVVCLGFAAGASAEGKLQPPEDEVQKITAELLGTFQKNKVEYKKNPDGFYQEVERLLSPVVAFDQVARYVMGRYAHRSPDQVGKFEATFKDSLIRFYGKALLALDDTTLVIESVDKTAPELMKKYEQGETSRIPVKMKVRTSSSVVEIFYSMVHVDGRWKLRNVTIEGINIAKQFQNQFADAIDKHKKVPYVVEHWAEILASNNTSDKK